MRAYRSVLVAIPFIAGAILVAFLSAVLAAQR
jgi:hypothetical protein